MCISYVLVTLVIGVNVYNLIYGYLFDDPLYVGKMCMRKIKVRNCAKCTCPFF